MRVKSPAMRVRGMGEQRNALGLLALCAAPALCDKNGCQEQAIKMLGSRVGPALGRVGEGRTARE